MVHELHKLGFQRLRVVPYLAGTNCWRVIVTPASRVLTTHGAWGPENTSVARYTEAASNQYFRWKDAKNDTSLQLAQKFISRFPKLCKAGLGRDWAYAGWYMELMRFADAGELPVASWDGMPPTDPRFLPTWLYVDSGLPMPPPGELPPGDFQPPQTGPLRPEGPVRTIRFANAEQFLAQFASRAAESSKGSRRSDVTRSASEGRGPSLADASG
jgi:hypothetical protein